MNDDHAPMTFDPTPHPMPDGYDGIGVVFFDASGRRLAMLTKGEDFASWQVWCLERRCWRLFPVAVVGRA